MRLLIDMNLTPRWAQYLMDAGHDNAIHWTLIGAPGATDWEICDYARKHACVVFTNDLDFPHILAHTNNRAPSILLLRGHPLTPEVRGPAVLAALHACQSDLASGAIVTLDHRDKHRARSLPLR